MRLFPRRRTVVSVIVACAAAVAGIVAHQVPQNPPGAQAQTAGPSQPPPTGLVLGEYCVSAVPDYEPWQLADPAFLDELAARALKVTLADGERRSIDVKLAGGLVDRGPGPVPGAVAIPF